MEVIFYTNPDSEHFLCDQNTVSHDNYTHQQGTLEIIVLDLKI